MANFPSSLPSSTPTTHGEVVGEIVAIATELKPRLTKFTQSSRTAGDLTTTSSTFTAVSTLLDLTIAAAAGDLLEVNISAASAGSATFSLVAFDVATMVSGSPVNWISGGLADGVTGWRTQGPSAGEIVPRCGAVYYTVQSGDVVSGAVTLRLFWRVNSGVTGTIYADGTQRALRFYALNHGTLTAT